MKQEHRLVAELYRYIAPFIDATKDIYLSLDGQAARTAVAAGRFDDSGIPDMWFTLLGADVPVRIEAKVIENNGRVLLMQSQLTAWRSSGGGAYKPKYWVATNRSFNEFYSWSHEEFLPSLDQSVAKANTLTLRPPPTKLLFDSVPKLALHVLRETNMPATFTLGV